MRPHLSADNSVVCAYHALDLPQHVQWSPGFWQNLASPGNSGGNELDVTTTSICGNRSVAFAARAAPLIVPAKFSSVNKNHTDSPMLSNTETAASALSHAHTSISDSSRSIKNNGGWLSLFFEN